MADSGNELLNGQTLDEREDRDERALWGAAFEDDEAETWPALVEPSEVVRELATDGEVVWTSGVAPKGTERVRFLAPTWLRVEGERGEVEGVVLNLSTRGMACAAWREMTAGERLWARFRAHLGAEPLTLLCEVLWRRAAAEQAPVYGLRFVSLADDEIEAIDSAVRERAEGRAAEWSLPIMPVESHVVPSRQHRGALVTGVLGALAGVVLGVVIAAVPRVVTSASAPVVAHATPAPAVVDESAAPAVVAAPPAVVAAPAPIVPLTPAPAPASKLLPRREVADEVASDGDTLRPLGGANQLELALPTDGPVDEHVAFWLENPHRLVVDVLGRQSAFEHVSYRVDHPLATRLRVGKYDHKVRFVIETTPGVAADVATRRQGNSLVVELKRR